MKLEWNKKTIPVRCRTLKLIDIYLFRFMLKRNEKKQSQKLSVAY